VVLRRSLGFAQLPTGAAVEVEAIFEIKKPPARNC
jgi:enamine deaminase RidA (YjgF/YER057c/UK114 family)